MCAIKFRNLKLTFISIGLWLMRLLVSNICSGNLKLPHGPEDVDFNRFRVSIIDSIQVLGEQHLHIQFVSKTTLIIIVLSLVENSNFRVSPVFIMLFNNVH